MNDAIAQGMLEPDVRMTDESRDWSHVKITAKGFSVVRRLVGRFAYWESIMLDTPLNDAAILNQIKGVYLEGHKPPLFHRMQCVKDFLAFLSRAEDLEQMRVRGTPMASECPALMAMVNEMMLPEFQRIQQEVTISPGI